MHKGHMQLSAYSTQALQALRTTALRSHLDLVHTQHALMKILAADEYQAAICPHTTYVIFTARKELAVVRQAQGMHQVVVVIGPESVYLLRLPDLPATSPHLNHELMLATTVSVATGEAMLEGLSAIAVALFARRQTILRISQSDRCHLISHDQGTTLGASIGVPWSYVLALLLKGYTPEHFAPPHLPHLLAAHPVNSRSTIKGATVRAQATFGSALQLYLEEFRQVEDVASVTHECLVVHADLESITTQPGARESALAFLRRQVAQTAFTSGDLTVATQPQRDPSPLGVTFVVTLDGHLREIWIEHYPNFDEDV